MRQFFTFFYEQRGGILVFLSCMLCLAVLLRYLAWIFGLGRFKAHFTKSTHATTGTGRSRETDDRIGFVVAEFFANLINDFRHLLALMLVLIFAAALGVAMWIADGSVDSLTNAIQGVTATLGGLIGSIIGYYFGESAVKRSQADRKTTPGGSPESGSNSSEQAAIIEKASNPPPKE